MSWYNQTRQVEELLAKNESQPPSFTVHLHPEHWTLNHGPKFLYNNHVASLLDDIRNHQIPVDFLDTFETARVPFYEGCMIVEILDYRPGKPTDAPLEAPERSRTVLHPTSESLWADICALNARQGNKWTDMDALEVEAKILLATTPPLCLDPDPNLTRMVNHIVKVSAPAVPSSLKRKASAVVQEEDETGKARRAKIMQFMASRSSRPSSFRLLENLQAARETVKTTPTTKPVAQAPPASARSSPAPSTTSAAPTPYTKPPTPVPEKIPQQPKDVPANQTFTAPMHPHPTQQQFQIQNPAVTKTNTPSPRTQTPHQAHQVPTFAVQVQDVTSRNPTPSKQHTQPQPQQSSPRAAPVPQPAVVPTPQPAAFQGVLPNPQFLQRPTAMQNNQMKMAKAPNGATFAGMQQVPMPTQQQQELMRQRYVFMHQQNQQQQQGQAPQQHQQLAQPQPLPQQQQVQQQATQPQQLTAQQQHQAQALQQHRQQQIQHAQHQLQQAQSGGRSSTAPTASAMMSPHVANQRIASRSPMPPQPQAAQVHLTPHQTHATPHQAHATPHQQHATPQPQPAQQHATPLQQHATTQQTPQMYQYNNAAAAAAAAQFHQRNTVGAANGSTASPRPQIQGQGQMYAYGYPQMYRLPPNITPQQAQMYWRMNPQMQGMNMNAQQLQQQQTHHQQLAAAQAAAANMKPQAGR